MSGNYSIQENAKLSEALVQFQAEIGAVAKTSANPFFKSKYAALPDVVQHAQPILAKHGLAVSQTIGFWSTEHGVIDTLTTVLIHQSGETVRDTMRLHLVKDDPQAQGSAVTYARRYAYMSILGLVADEDDDGNAASAQRSQAPARPQQSAPRPAQSAPAEVPTDAPSGVRVIIQAANEFPNDEFLNSLAQQYASRGSLSEKQMNAGRKAAYAALKNAGIEPISSDTERTLAKAFPGVSELLPGEEPF